MTNMHSTDRSARIIIALIALFVYFTHIFNGTISVLLLVVSGVFLLTGFSGFCPLYRLFGIKRISKSA